MIRVNELLRAHTQNRLIRTKARMNERRNKLKPQNFSCRHLKSLRSWTGGNNFTNYAGVISTRRKTKQKHTHTHTHTKQPTKRRKRICLHSTCGRQRSAWSGNFLRCAKQKAKLSLFRFFVFVSWCSSSLAEYKNTYTWYSH